MSQQEQQPVRKTLRPAVRFMGQVTGCYALSQRRDGADEPVPVYACRLLSISTNQASIVTAVAVPEGQTVVMHFPDFGMLRAQVARELPTGFAAELILDEDAKDKLAAKIRWKRDNSRNAVPDLRDHPRILPRNPRSVLTLGDGSHYPCFVIDISQSGAAVSAAVLPARGAHVAVGAMVGQVVRRLDIGFAVEFSKTQPTEELEKRMAMPPGADLPKTERPPLLKIG
ncbi:PilZ domain-containing protein [Devosia sp. 2618]|uniref:PilZ domain-containing protein n=1 Tax=Devosia sp. 2618 TaxID=3156454 RepID=UPI0033954618